MSGAVVMAQPCAAWWGKLPCQGDFVGRRLPHGVTQHWDEWLRNGMDQLRMDAGPNWSTRFVETPPWFFLCPPPVMGLAMVGVIGPSVDRIGRFFPLAIMATATASDLALTEDGNIECFLAGARDVLADARRFPLTPQQVDDRLTMLPWPFRLAQRDPLIEELLHDLGNTPSLCRPSVQLPRADWRNCMRPDSSTSVWWISPSPNYPADEIVQPDVLHRHLFTRLFKGSAH